MKYNRYRKIISIFIAILCFIGFTGCISGFFVDAAHAHTYSEETQSHTVVEELKGIVLEAMIETEDNLSDFICTTTTYRYSSDSMENLKDQFLLGLISIVSMSGLLVCLWNILQNYMLISLDRHCNEIRVCKEGDGKKKCFTII